MNNMNNLEEISIIEKMVLDNEKIGIAVVDKKSYKVIYHNERFYDIMPNIKVGAIYYELQGKTEAEKECFERVSQGAPNIDKNNPQWIRKVIEYNINSVDNQDGIFIIYYKDSIEYISQVNSQDSLTKSLLFNGFEEYYTEYVQRNQYKYALCSIDIDKFKYVNSVFGYEVGDEVLKRVATVVRDFIDKEENFCRMNEDKFSIFLKYENEVQLHLKVRELAEKFENMRDCHFSEAKITIIGGVTIVNKQMTLNSLLDQATIARKSGKGSHKNKFSFYNPTMDVNIRKEIQIEERVPHAMANGEFQPFLQPKFDLETKKICGAEALVRWITPTGMIYPDEFIPLFERNGFIVTLDFIIYEKVMIYIRECLDKNLPVYPISVNVSRNHIKDKHFMDKFMHLIRKYNIPCEFLELEVTESVFVEDKVQLKHFIDSIKSESLKVSIDDFGTAYSSLQILTDINVDILKIDKGFLDNINTNTTEEHVVTKDEILIKNIINLAKELEFKVICEGVETNEQIELLKNIGCELGQGYVFAKPMPLSEYEDKYLL
ncbi:MAG: bifunctional diguanylate cyclase/phosphodiesterase [bacterium]